MSALASLWYSLRALLWRQRIDHELDEELAFHLERETALLESRGLSPRAARREAIRQFGGVQRYREECRDVRRTHLFDDARADVRFALRMSRREPGFAASVILISALGVFACATTFSIVSGILLAPLPFATPDRVAELELKSSEGPSAAIPLPAYLRIAAGSPVIDAISAFEPASAMTTIDGEPQRLKSERVTASFFRVFGIRPVVGRFFSDDEAINRAPVLLLGHAEWASRFRSDANVVGRRISIDGSEHTIIGVMPPKFSAHFVDERPIWQPFDVRRSGGTVNAMVRLRDGMTHTRAESWLAGAIHEKVESNVSTDSLPAVPVLEPIANLVYGTVRRPLLILFGAVVLVLLLVSANVATMFLARSASRERELDVRRALGASAGREARQLVTESLVLTGVGGLLGVLASRWGVGLVAALGDRILPRVDEIALDWRVLSFGIAAIAFTGVVGGVAPAISARRRAIEASRMGARATGSQRLSTALVVAQVALSFTLVVGAGLLVKGFLRIAPVDPGFALDNRATLSVSLTDKELPRNDRGAAQRFVAAVTERLMRVDGVRDVAVAWMLPFSGMSAPGTVTIPGRPNVGPPLRAYRNLVSANYFDVMRIPVRGGRALASSDARGNESVVVINETAAARWWPGINALGQRLTVSGGSEAATAVVVGVVGDARLRGTDTRIRPEVYLPLEAGSPRTINFVVRTTVAPRSLTRELKRAVWAVSPALPVANTDLETMAAGAVRSPRFFSTAMGLFAGAAVVLSGLGMYGLLAFAVAQRRREIGIRIALGAPPRRIGRSVLARALAMGCAGVGIGLVLARASSRYLESLLIETSPTDAVVFACSASGVLVLAVLAACAPAYRAVRTDPIETLKG